MTISLHLPFGGANDSQVFTDNSIYHHAITAHGTAKITTADSVIGGSAGLFDGNAQNYLSLLEDATLNFADNDFTIRFRLKPTAQNSNYQGVLQNGFGISMLITSEGNLYVAISYNGSTNAVVTNSSIACDIPLNTPTAISIEVYQQKLYIYKNGTRLNTGITLTAPIYYSAGRTIAIGGNPINNTAFIGIIDELFIDNGTALAAGAGSYAVETTELSVYKLLLTLIESLAATDFIVRLYNLKTGALQTEVIKQAGDFVMPAYYNTPYQVVYTPCQGDIWQPSTAYALNALVFPTAPETTPYYYKRIAAGTSGTTEPTWNTAAGGQCTDGIVANAWERVARLTQPIIHGPLIPTA